MKNYGIDGEYLNDKIKCLKMYMPIIYILIKIKNNITNATSSCFTLSTNGCESLI